MTQEEIWEKNYWEMYNFMEQQKRRPSKHRLEEHRMLNWYKYVKKRLASDKLSSSQKEMFCRLQDLADKVQRVNQHAYLR